MTVKYAFLVMEEHPWGRIMLENLLKLGCAPGLIVNEVSNVAEVERGKFETRMAGQPVHALISDLVNNLGIEVLSVPNHNDPKCKEILENYQPELTVLGGTRIIKDYILSIAKLGTINTHPGLLPWLRGSSSVGWALYKNIKQGATVHYINPGIDTGAIILREELPVYHSDTYETLNYRVTLLAAQLTARVVQRFWNNEKVVGEPQDTSIGETFRVIPEDLLEIGKQNLANGGYSHYAD